MNKNNGITIVTLAITIVILILLAGTTTYVVDRITTKMKIENVKTNMLLIQAKIKTIAEKHNFDETNALIGTETSIDTNKYGVDSEKQYYLISSQDLKDMNLESIEYDSNYYVCYETEEVIYGEGIENNDGKMLYTLSQIKDEG